jgi:hypothetical protein
MLNHFLLRAYRYDSSEHLFTEDELNQLKQAHDILYNVYHNRKKNSEEHFGIISAEKRKELKKLKKDEISRRQNKV